MSSGKKWSKKVTIPKDRYNTISRKKMSQIKEGFPQSGVEDKGELRDISSMFHEQDLIHESVARLDIAKTVIEGETRLADENQRIHTEESVSVTIIPEIKQNQHLKIEEKTRLLKRYVPKNLDLDYKLLGKLLYNKKGYYCELECKLFGNSYNQKYKREEISDIDVYGIKFEDDLCCKKIGLECKTTQDNGVDEALKIKGIQAYCSLDMVGLIKKRVSNNVRIVANKVDVQIFDEMEIRKLVDLLIIDWDKRFKIEREFYTISNGIEQECNGKLRGILAYLNGNYWVKQPHENFHTLVRGLESLDKSGLMDYQLKYFAIKISILLSLTLLQITSKIVKYNLSSFDQVALDLLFGGATARREKERTYDLLSQEIQKRIDPYAYYTKDYLNIIGWLISGLGASARIPLCLEQYLICYLMEDNFQELKNYSDAELKLAKDILRFTSKILAKDKLFAEIIEL